MNGAVWYENPLNIAGLLEWIVDHSEEGSWEIDNVLGEDGR